MLVALPHRLPIRGSRSDPLRPQAGVFAIFFCKVHALIASTAHNVLGMVLCPREADTTCLDFFAFRLPLQVSKEQQETS